MTTRYKILTIAAILAITILPFSGGCSGTPGTIDPLFLSIDSPQDREVVKINLIKVTGKVADPKASVFVNGKKAIIDTTGDYFSYIEIPEGANSIKASTTIDGEKYVYDIDISFEPRLVIVIDQIRADKDVDYRSAPFEITGYVSDPQAIVTVNEMPADVKNDGNFSAKIQLVVGENGVMIEATSGTNTNRMGDLINLSPGGKASRWPQTGGDRLDIVPFIYLQPGETVFGDIHYSAGIRDIPRPEELRWEIYRVSELYGEEEIPAPEGLDVIAEPPTFKVHPGRGYPSTIIVTAAADVTPGEYYYRIQAKVDEGGWLTGFTVIVES